MKYAEMALGAALLAAGAAAQTRIDLRAQGRNVDFSGMTSTRPVRVGAALPSNCNTGELFFKTDEAAGKNLYGCAAGVWNKLGSGSNPLPDLTGQRSKALFSNGSDAVWEEAVRTLTPGAGLITVCADGAGPSSGDCSVSLDEWYVATQYGVNVFTGANDFSGAASLRVKSGGELPATCNVAEVFFKKSAPAGLNWYGCTSQNTWTLLGGGGGGGGSVSSVFGRTGGITAQSGDYTAAQVTHAVDASATYQNPSWLGSLAWAKITGTPSIPANTDGLPEGSGNQYFTNARALAAVNWGALSGKPSAFPPSGHKSSHAAGGNDALTAADIGAQPALGYVAENAANRGQAGGYAPLDGAGKLPAAYLPALTSASSYALTFDGSTTTLEDGSIVAWTASGNQRNTVWTVPDGVRWLRVQVWAGGAGGMGSTNTFSGSGGAGGGYHETVCRATPGDRVAIAVGMGGAGGVNFVVGSGAGGNTTVTIGETPCVSVTGGEAGSGTNGQWGGRLAGTSRAGWTTGSSLMSFTSASCGSTGGAHSVRLDGGGCGAGSQTTAATAGRDGGSAIGGGGGGASGGNEHASGGTGGTSGMGGRGGNGGGWNGSAFTPCEDGAIPGGGGGAAGAHNPGTAAGCNGARGEIRLYFLK
jgi:hypothetical protein